VTASRFDEFLIDETNKMNDMRLFESRVFDETDDFLSGPLKTQ
jgi:hypothetical protein